MKNFSTIKADHSLNISYITSYHSCSIEVLLLEDIGLLQNLQGLKGKYELPVTGGIHEGMRMIDALLGEEGIRQRSRLTPH